MLWPWQVAEGATHNAECKMQNADSVRVRRLRRLHSEFCILNFCYAGNAVSIEYEM